MFNYIVKLKEYETYEDNWDSYGGRKISPTVIARVKYMIPKLYAIPHEVAPLNSGGIQLSYEIGSNYIEVEIHEKGNDGYRILDDVDFTVYFPFSEHVWMIKADTHTIQFLNDFLLHHGTGQEQEILRTE